MSHFIANMPDHTSEWGSLKDRLSILMLTMLFLLKTFLDFWKLHNIAKKCKNIIAEPEGQNLPSYIWRATVQKKNYIYHLQFTDKETEATSLVQGHLPIRGDVQSVRNLLYHWPPYNRMGQTSHEEWQRTPDASHSGGRLLVYSGCFKGKMFNQAQGGGGGVVEIRKDFTEELLLTGRGFKKLIQLFAY